MGRLTLQQAIKGHQDWVWQVAWSPDGSLLASCSGDKSVKLWGQPRGSQEWECVLELQDGPSRTIRGVCWSPCGQYIAAASFDGFTTIWQRSTRDSMELGYEVITVLDGHENEVKAVAWQPNGEHLATCGRDKTIYIYEVGDPASTERFICLDVVTGHEGDVKMVAWHPTEKLLLSASYDDTLKLWGEHGEDWFCTQTLVGHKSTVWCAAFDAPGERIASVSADMTLLVWRRFRDQEESEWRKVCSLSGYHEQPVYSVSWCCDASDSALICTAAGDNCIRLFRESEGSSASSEEPSFDLDFTMRQAHSGDVNCVAWCKRGQNHLLASAGDDSNVNIWMYSEGC